MQNAFSVDVEDYYQVAAFGKIIRRDDWDKYESRVVENTRRMLDLLDGPQTPVKATFFVLGYIAERHPELVPEVTARGHEIASHGWGHQLVYELSESEFRDDVQRARDILRSQSGQEVIGYRAPSFSIGKRTPNAHQILAEVGYRYDSSVFPIHHDIGGDASAPLEIHEIATPSGVIQEFPPTVFRFLRQNIPTGGGGYFRFFPYFVTKMMLRRVNAVGRPFVFYIHPWEIDPDQPRIADAPLKSRFRHYINLRQTAARLQKLFADFTFGTIQDVLGGPC